MHSLDIATTGLGKEYKIVMRAGGEEVLDEIALFGLILRLSGSHAYDPLATALLGAIGTDCRSLDESLVGDGDNTPFIGDEVLNGDLTLFRDELRETGARVLFLDGKKLSFDNGKDTFFAGQNINKIGYGLE